MAITSRQTSLLAAENWKTLYQTFKEAEFTSYDFETLRKTMIDYLRINYPEEFNDYIESSEFVALIDLIAFLGQSLAFRTDLNARENFIDTAERRDSILKLAKLISYTPKRSTPASGLLKIESISTTESIIDTDGFNLSNTIINWNDPANDNWQEQFATILNAALISTQVVGKPSNSQTINNIKTDEYNLSIPSNIIPAFSFEASINGNRTQFEVVSATSINNTKIYEATPDFNRTFNILFRNDGSGNASNNTGYFFYFKQGQLRNFDFSVSDSLPNRVVDVNVNNINNDDFWLYKLNSSNQTEELWQMVPAATGVNIIYNRSQDRNLYQVSSRAGDQISLVFGDGAFANIPQGNFKLYYRTSNGLSYRITPDEIQDLPISINYISRSNRQETLSFTVSLKYTISNAQSRENIDDIRQRAPQQYYTQNRMITGEDYNIFPYSKFSKIIKSKAINRTSVGLSKYLDIIDSTGKYSSTNAFGQDGVIYKDQFTKIFNFKFINNIDIERVIYNNILNKIIKSKETLHYFYANSINALPAVNLINSGSFVIGKTYIIKEIGNTDFKEIGAMDNRIGVSFVASGVGSGTGKAMEAYIWNSNTFGNNNNTGYFLYNNQAFAITKAVTTNGKYLNTGAIVKFVAPPGYYFNSNNNLILGTPSIIEDRREIFAAILNVIDTGTNSGQGSFNNGLGPVTLNNKVPTGALIDFIIPSYQNNFSSSFIASLVHLINQYKNFGITFNSDNQTWEIVSENNLNNNSWYIKFEFNNINSEYLVSYKGINYVFHSPNENTFYFDEDIKIFDSRTSRTVTDTIKILRTNNRPNSVMPLGTDSFWQVYDKFVEIDGYTNNTKIYVTFADNDSDGIPDDPKIFEFLVDPGQLSASKYIFFKSETNQIGINRYLELILLNRGEISVDFPDRNSMLSAVNNLEIGQILYAFNDNLFYSVVAGISGGKTISAAPLSNYQAYIGRQELYYQYKHNSPNSRRINPSISNIIDLYILTTDYNTSYRQWIQDTSNSIIEPAAPRIYELEQDFQNLNEFKSLSDTLIYQPALYKPIFGEKSRQELQATFKVVKNSNLSISDEDIKTSVINAINSFFEIENWDFGETFYFSELSAYLHRVLSPNIASIMIVPKDKNIKFGALYQINSEPNEILISSATVNDIEIVSAITAAQLNVGIN
jgi:hypothetical protein